MRFTMRAPSDAFGRGIVQMYICAAVAASLFGRSPTPAVGRAVVLAVGSGGSPLQFASVHAFCAVTVPVGADSASMIDRIRLLLL